MVTAYDRGARSGEPTVRRSIRSAAPVPRAHPELDGDIGYPVLVASTGTATAMIETVEASPRGSQVQLVALDDSPQTLAAELSHALADGGCAVVIRNTVNRVRETARYLSSVLTDTEVIVNHARFVATDRAANDQRLLDLFGPNGSAHRQNERFVVVASQVVEQSLDVDFDLMVTDLAPVDLVLQRIGRLHRHPRGVGQSDRSPRLRAPRCLITGIEDWSETPPSPVRGSRYVYESYHLYRSLAVLDPQLSGGVPLRLPEDIAPLVQRAYAGENVGPADWTETINTARTSYLEKSAEESRQPRYSS
jgi:hypothetical protein